MKNLIAILVIITALSSCQSPEARRPVTVKSAAFVDRSVEFNRQLIQTQKDQIEQIIKNNPDRSFIASPNGFWYAYDTKIEGDSISPKFGDMVSFIYDVEGLNDNSIYTREDIGIQNYAMEQEELMSGLAKD